jgi:hypothetical protein
MFMRLSRLAVRIGFNQRLRHPVIEWRGCQRLAVWFVERTIGRSGLYLKPILKATFQRAFGCVMAHSNAWKLRQSVSFGALLIGLIGFISRP